MWKFNFRHAPYQFKNFPDHFLILSHCFTQTQNFFLQIFAQRRWVYLVVEATSWAKVKKWETYSKDYLNQTD